MQENIEKVWGKILAQKYCRHLCVSIVRVVYTRIWSTMPSTLSSVSNSILAP
jgi:hypothetical protein